MKHRLTLAAAAAALLTTAPAFAVSTASASMGPIAVTLIDLNPLDNVLPSITFNNPYQSYGDQAYAYASDSFTGQNSYLTAYGNGPFDPVSISTTGVTNAWASADVSGPGTAPGTMLNASGTALGTSAPGAFSYQNSQYQSGATAPYYYYNQSFTLSANTLVLISAPVSLSTAVTQTFDPYTSYQHEYASANAQISLSGTGASGTGSQSSSDNRSIGVGSTYVSDLACFYGYCYTGSSATDSATFGVSFVNLTSGTLDGNAQMSVSTYGYSYANAVPEPGTYAMLLAGLAAVGFMVRRRRA